MSCKSYKCWTVNRRVPEVASLTVLGKGSELKNLILEQPVKTQDCSNTQFVLRGFAFSFLHKCTLKCGLRKKIFFVIS